ncbi:uncharacterized protein LOC107835341 [Poecilia formosa]|uniref:uncharacterized protein LOC107835341 n=1 Tax=Poecilia formosa TaxID=48698 RepID=UPI0007B9C7A1|nr:PREDICTED: uncharacterized protein LOC107835341 [Poecilia formosa]
MSRCAAGAVTVTSLRRSSLWVSGGWDPDRSWFCSRSAGPMKALIGVPQTGLGGLLSACCGSQVLLFLTPPLLLLLLWCRVQPVLQVLLLLFLRPASRFLACSATCWSSVRTAPAASCCCSGAAAGSQVELHPLTWPSWLRPQDPNPQSPWRPRSLQSWTASPRSTTSEAGPSRTTDQVLVPNIIWTWYQTSGPGIKHLDLVPAVENNSASLMMFSLISW